MPRPKWRGQRGGGFSRLAGLSEPYLAAQLAAFADGTRENSIMQPFAKTLSLDGREAVAQYFSSLPAPKDLRLHDDDASVADTGAWLATRGRWQQDLPACVQCHGPGGAGVGAVFPPLWGAQSFNWGAGMHEIQNAAGFIKANMPPGLGGTLTDQEAWDAATFMDSHERPQDPRYSGSVAQTRAKYHDTPYSMYGMSVNGHVLVGQ